jgi:O-antigen/teichoic acid export membrane protein
LRVFSKIRQHFTSSEFTKNVLTLITGTALAQLIPLILAPFLSRIYSPTEFGRLSIYLSIVQVLSAISNGRYELAIILPKKLEESVRVTMLAFLICVAVSLLSFFVLIFWSDEIANIFGDPELSGWLLLVPFSIFMTGTFNSFTYFNVRQKEFNIISRSNVMRSLGGGLSQLTIGLLKFTSGGLIIGQTLSFFFGNMKMSKPILLYFNVIKKTKVSFLFALAKRYINFPKFSIWGIFLNNFSMTLPNFFISYIFSLAAVGQFSYAYKYLGLPIALIGTSIGQVYLQKLTEVKENRNDRLNVFHSTFKKLMIFSFLIFVPCYFLIEDVFVLIFGEEWAAAGQFAKILIPLMAIRLIVSTLSVTLISLEKQKGELVSHILILTFSFSVWFSGYYFGLSLPYLLSIYSWVMASAYLIVCGYIYYELKKDS